MSHSSTHFPKETHSNILLKGPCGNIEVITTWPEAAALTEVNVAVICHPHPLFQGSMHNKVVSTLAKAYINRGMATIRFNFRGVGKSDGEYGHVKGEIEDAKAILSWLEKVLPQRRLYLAGFSFGSYIAAFCASQRQCEHLISIAPPISHMPFSQLPPMQSPWHIIQGTDDEIVDAKALITWDENRQHDEDRHLYSMQGAGHFFHGRLIELRELIERCIIG